MSHRQTESGGCAIVEHIQGESLDLESLRECIECRGQPVERIDVLPLFGNLGESETRQVRRDDTIVIGQAGNEFSEHERRSREPMKQQHSGGIRVPSRAVEYPDTIRLDLV